MSIRYLEVLIARKEQNCIALLNHIQRNQIIQEAMTYSTPIAYVDLCYVFWLMNELGHHGRISKALFGEASTESYLKGMNLANHEQWKILVSFCKYCGVEAGFAGIFLTRIVTEQPTDILIPEVVHLAGIQTPQEAYKIIDFIPAFLLTQSLSSIRLAMAEAYIRNDRAIVKKRLIEMLRSQVHAEATYATLKHILINMDDKTAQMRYLEEMAYLVVTEHGTSAKLFAVLISRVLAMTSMPVVLYNITNASVYLAIKYALDNDYLNPVLFDQSEPMEELIDIEGPVATVDVGATLEV